jgi:hypothetical protein
MRQKPTKKFLRQVRQFLAPHWKTREMDVGRLKDMGDKPSHGQCDYTSVFLMMVLGRGELRGGFKWKKGVAQNGGGLDGELHYWLEDEGIIYDLTADQFGHPQVVVAAPGSDLHRLYVSNFDTEELLAVTKHWKHHLQLVFETFQSSLQVQLAA